MKREIIFATHNINKLKEVQNLIGPHIHLKSLDDYNFHEEVPEDYDTLQENARQKATYVFNALNVPCFADDTGLEVDALGGAPGVYSARFAGPERNDKKNTALLLEKLADLNHRQAQFRTVIAYYDGHQNLYFEGIVKGEIMQTPKGEKGFGYDPVFKPLGYDVTFAEMSMAEKNQISHRARAFNKLKDFLTGS